MRPLPVRKDKTSQVSGVEDIRTTTSSKLHGTSSLVLKRGSTNRMNMFAEEPAEDRPPRHPIWSSPPPISYGTVLAALRSTPRANVEKVTTMLAEQYGISHNATTRVREHVAAVKFGFVEALKLVSVYLPDSSVEEQLQSRVALARDLVSSAADWDDPRPDQA